MGPVSIGFGTFLILLGGVGFALAMDADKPLPWTALIPSGFGVALVVLGLLARKDSLRKHVMHAAALLGLVGFALPQVMVIRRALNPAAAPSAVAVIEQAVMADVCLVFLVLCVKSFIDARRSR
jgi:hypothetical protein